MLRRRRELEGFIKNRISADTMQLVIDYVRETLDEHVERLVEMNETSEDLLRRQGRAQGLKSLMHDLEEIHRESRIGGTRNN